MSKTVIQQGRFEYSTACLGSVAFSTNGPQGGDAGHGGFLEITFDTEKCSTALEAVVNGESAVEVETVTLRFRGDAEMRAAFDCLQYLVKKLKK